jgi:hypothetical protein
MVALLVILMRLVDLFWLMVPDFQGHGSSLHFMDVAAPIGLGGVWIWFFLTQLKNRPLLPVGDPELDEALASRGAH